MGAENKIGKWITLTSEMIGKYRVFSVKKIHQRSPDSNKESDFFIFNCEKFGCEAHSF